MKDNKEVIAEFNEYVNMTASELEKWLKTDDSNNGAGWTNGDGDGETVGHHSGRTIVEILKANPDKKPDKYTDEQLQHMRKVASYCKRHLAQESAGNKDKDPEEVKKTKSYISLKNWGHDFLKAQEKNGGSKKKPEQKAEDDEEEVEEEEKEEKVDDDEDEDEDDDEGKKAGDKRKRPAPQNESNKKRETRKTRSADKKDEKDNGNEDNGDDDGEDDDEDDQDKDGSEKKSSKNGSNNNAPKKGDTVSWNWGNGKPQGKVLDVKEDKAAITTKRGNEVTRDGTSEDPAVILDTGKSKAIKSAHELN